MRSDKFLAIPDRHLDPWTAANYDLGVSDHFSPDVVEPAVSLLAELADNGIAVEFAVGTGRLALPLSRAGVTVKGIDFSENMLAELRKKEGSDAITITHGDMTETRVCSDASLVYLVFNTIQNLRTQRLQTDCFRNAEAHLRPGGRFVVETMVPELHRLPAGESIRPFDVSENHVGFDEYIDRVAQILISHHYFINGNQVRNVTGAMRYVWPAELDLMAELAGMTLESRFSDWKRTPFTGDSESHVSIYIKPDPRPRPLVA